MSDDDIGDALCCCCLYCAAECAGACLESAGASGDGKSSCVLTTLALLVLLLVTAVALAVTLSVRPVRVTVDDASLTRLAPAAGANGTMRLAYAVSLSVTLRNRNVEMSVEHTLPLDADLRFAGRRLVITRLLAATGPGRHSQLRRKETAVYRVVAAGESADDIGSDGVAEFVKQSTAGVVELEVKVTGEVRYPPHHGKHRIDATFPLTFPSSLLITPGPGGGVDKMMKSDSIKDRR